jgi:hypothetical protein
MLEEAEKEIACGLKVREVYLRKWLIVLYNISQRLTMIFY